MSTRAKKDRVAARRKASWNTDHLSELDFWNFYMKMTAVHTKEEMVQLCEAYKVSR